MLKDFFYIAASFFKKNRGVFADKKTILK